MKGYRLIAFLCLTMMLFNSIPALAITTAEKESNYKAAVFELETYLESSGNSSAALAGIAASFAELGGYEQSKFLGYYVAVLQKISNEKYDSDMKMYLEIMESNPKFNAFLQDAGSSFGSVEILKSYALAREYQHNGMDEKALDLYFQCSGFLDASERIIWIKSHTNETTYSKAFSLLEKGDLVGAYCQFASISSYSDSSTFMDSIVNQLGYTPASPTDTLMPVTGLKVSGKAKASITLSWNSAKHAKTYEVYYKQQNQSAWNSFGEVTTTSATISGLDSGKTYDFKVISTIGSIKADPAILNGQKVFDDAKYQVGKYITFGTYPQTASGTDSTPIEWLILERDGNKALLISRYILDGQPYNYKTNSTITWENCYIRSWLNEYFLNRAFSPIEQVGILVTTVDNSQSQGTSKHQTISGNNTYDMIFLLSYYESEQYFPNDEARRSVPTEYAIQQGVHTVKSFQVDGRPSGWWWLRSILYRPGDVGPGGWLNDENSNDTNGVRPVLWIDAV